MVSVKRASLNQKLTGSDDRQALMTQLGIAHRQIGDALMCVDAREGTAVNDDVLTEIGTDDAPVAVVGDIDGL